MRSVTSNSETPRTAARQAPLSMGFPRQEHWSGLPFPSPGDLPNPGTEPRSPTLQVESLLSEPPGKPYTPMQNKKLKKKKKTHFLKVEESHGELVQELTFKLIAETAVLKVASLNPCIKMAQYSVRWRSWAYF